MFGLFKKKKNDTEIKKFTLELANVCSAFEASIGEVDEGIMHRALNNYLENNPEEAGFTASDFYFDAFVGAFGQATIEGNIPPEASLGIFTTTQNFIFSSGEYQTEATNKMINNWQTILASKGVI